MSENRIVSTEEVVLNAVRRLLTDDVNKLLDGLGIPIPRFEFGNHAGREVAVPDIMLSKCERTEKERILFTSAYTVELNIPVDDLRDYDGELYMFAYSTAISRAVRLNPSLGGAVNNAVITASEFMEPKKRYCGDNWMALIEMRVTTEGLLNDGVWA